MAGTAGAVWGIHAAAPILGPIVLAFVLTVVAHPIIGALVRRGVRRAIAVAIAVLLVDGGLIGFALALVVSFGQLATVLPEYSDEWEQAPGRHAVHAGRAGIGPQQVEDALQSIEPQHRRLGRGGPPRRPRPARSPRWSSSSRRCCS